MRYLMGVALNESPNRFFRYEQGDALKMVRRPEGGSIFITEGDTIEQALEQMFKVGQKEFGPDSEGREYPVTERSISVGDVILVSGNGRYEVAFAGFRKLEAL